MPATETATDHLPRDGLQLDGRTAVLVIIGDPIAQVKAPAPLTRLLQSHGLNAVLVPMQVKAGDVGPVLDLLGRVPNVAGVIVTVPHKQRVAALLQDKTPMAAAAQAVNVVRRTAAGWQGDLLDGTGFVAGLVKNGCDPRGRSVGLAGAGGAGNAIAFALAEAGAASIAVHELDAAKRDDLLARLRAHGCDATPWDGAAPRDLLVNATPCGMREGDPLPIDLAALVPGAMAADVIMEPAVTRWLTQAGAQGARTVPGRHMMEQQLDGMLQFFKAAL